MARCRITVLRRMINEDYAQEYCADPKTGVCDAFTEGQVFDLKYPVKPEGFCEEAWSAITRYVFSFSVGGGGFFNGGWMKAENTMIACCNDGIRPVVFKLERIDD
jgi:uncharacterized repeat protein (TIGR04076 family)